MDLQGELLTLIKKSILKNFEVSVSRGRTKKIGMSENKDKFLILSPNEQYVFQVEVSYEQQGQNKRARISDLHEVGIQLGKTAKEYFEGAQDFTKIMEIETSGF